MKKPRQINQLYSKPLYRDRDLPRQCKEVTVSYLGTDPDVNAIMRGEYDGPSFTTLEAMDRVGQ